MSLTIYRLNGSLPKGVEAQNRTLFFRGPITYSLAGTYICEATNPIGTRSGQVEVNITGKNLSVPEAPRPQVPPRLHPLRSSHRDGKSASFSPLLLWGSGHNSFFAVFSLLYVGLKSTVRVTLSERGQQMLFSAVAFRGVILAWWGRSAGGAHDLQVLQLEVRKPVGLQGEARLKQNTRQCHRGWSEQLPDSIGYICLQTELLFSQIFLSLHEGVCQSGEMSTFDVLHGDFPWDMT